MSSAFNDSNPLVAAFFSRNPVSILAQAALAARFKKNANAPNPDLAGSNNAGVNPTTAAQPTMPTYRGMGMSTARPRYPISNGIYQNGPMNSPMNSMAQMGSNNESPMLGGSPVSFAAGGMLTEEGTAVRPGMPMPPSAGTGRTLPSARFKVEAQPPQGPQPMGMAGVEGPQLGATGEQLTPQEIEHEAEEFVKQHPEEVQKIQEVIALAMQTGELTPEELNTAVQLAKTALASPQSYPQIRQFAIKNGLGTEQDIPQQMDQGLLYVLIVAGKSMAPEGNAMQGQGPSPTQQPKPSSVVPEYSDGGMTGNKTHIAKLHPREYVIPEDALIYHGKKHFDKLVEQARTPPDAGTN